MKNEKMKKYENMKNIFSQKSQSECDWKNEYCHPFILDT